MDGPSDTNEDALAGLLERIGEVRPLPASVLRVIELTGDRRATVDQLIDAVDPALAARLLRVANSAHYGHQAHVSSIHGAVVLLGFSAVRDAAVASVAVADSGGVGSFDSRRFWTYSITVAEVAQLIGKALGRHQDQAFTAGVLHAIGRMVLAQSEGGRLVEAQALAADHRMSFEAAQLEVFGVTEAALGGALAERWAFPTALVESIASHPTPPRSQLDPTSLAADVERACAFTRACGLWDGIEPQQRRSQREVDSEWFSAPLAKALREAGGMPALRDRAITFVAGALGEVAQAA